MYIELKSNALFSMHPIFLAILSAFILSIDQVFLKYLIDQVNINNIYESINLKIISLSLLIILIGLVGITFWFLALVKSELTSIYWTTSFYYIAVPFFSFLILKENITLNQYIGFFVITIGALISAYE